MQKIFIVFISLLIISCGQKKTEKEPSSTIKAEETTSNKSKIGRQNFAVVWKWETTDSETVIENLLTISDELTQLWKDDIMENAYYDPAPQKDRLDNLANIAFFIKAHTADDVKAILDKLLVVKKGFASYTLHPVGTLWLDRKTDVIHKNGITKSFVAIWSTSNNQASDEVVKSQSDAILKLWKEGQIENVYFDIEGTQKKNNKTDFVFFINTNTLQEAESICKSLPFFKNQVAAYKIQPVGVFWYGKYQEQ